MKKGILLTVVLFQMTIVQAYSPFNKNGDNNMSQKTFFDNKEISNYDIGGDAKINALYNEVKGNSSYTNFEIDVPTTNSYFLNFWLCPARLSSNEYAVYNVLIDGLKIGCITPRKGDWQSISIDDNTSVVIQKGSHVLSITGVIPDIPSVEFVKLSAQRATSTISVNAYQKYKKDLVERSSNMSEKNGMALTAYSDSLSGIPKESPARSYWFLSVLIRQHIILFIKRSTFNRVRQLMSLQRKSTIFLMLLRSLAVSPLNLTHGKGKLSPIIQRHLV